MTQRLVLSLYIAGSFLLAFPEFELFYRDYQLHIPGETFFPDVSSTIILALALLGCLFFAAGKWPRIAALLLFVLWRKLEVSHMMSIIPPDPYLCWVLGSYVLLNEETRRSTLFQHALWTVTAFSYGMSAAMKLMSATWRGGDAVGLILQSPLSHVPFAASWDTLCHLLTWSTILLEVAPALALCIPCLRAWVLGGLFTFHLSILMTMKLPSVSIGMLVFHLFMLNEQNAASWRPTWWRRHRPPTATS